MRQFDSTVPDAGRVVAGPHQRRAVPGWAGGWEQTCARSLWGCAQAACDSQGSLAQADGGRAKGNWPLQVSRACTPQQGLQWAPRALPAPVDGEQAGLAAVALAKGEELDGDSLALAQRLVK